MADKFGALSLPVAAGGRTTGDPALFYLGGYLQAVLNAKVGAAWKATVVPNAALSLSVPVVRDVIYEDPSERGFNESDLPALYLFRSEGVTDQIAEEWNTQNDWIDCQWVFSTAVQIEQLKRRGFANAVKKAVHAAVENERDPSYVVPGDPDPQAATEGSNIFRDRYINPVSLHLRSARLTTLVLRSAPASMRGYPMLEMRFSIVEVLEESLDRFAQHQTQGVTVSPDGGPVVAGDIFSD